jgi:hypothetical protein
VVYDELIMIDPAIGALLAGALALLFFSAALYKLRDLGYFAEILAAYELLPAGVAPAARLLPLFELAVGAGLLSGGLRPTAAAAGAVLLLLYAAAIAINLRRGRNDLSCGCGGTYQRRPIAAWMVYRNLALAAALLALRVPWLPRPLSAADALTIGAGIATAALLYMGLDRLLALGGAQQRSRAEAFR